MSKRAIRLAAFVICAVSWIAAGFLGKMIADGHERVTLAALDHQEAFVSYRGMAGRASLAEAR